jgi:hypothetical protein
VNIWKEGWPKGKLVILNQWFTHKMKDLETEVTKPRIQSTLKYKSSCDKKPNHSTLLDLDSCTDQVKK